MCHTPKNLKSPVEARRIPYGSGQQSDFLKSRPGCFGAELFDVGSYLPDHLRTEKPKIALPGKIRQG
jgi:hypothetical protein